MAIDATQLRDNAELLRFFDNDECEGRYQLALNINPIDEENVEVIGAIGDMTTEYNIELGLYLIDKGYRYIHFEVGKRVTAGVTRWATLKGEDEKYRYYLVDLDMSEKIFNGE